MQQLLCLQSKPLGKSCGAGKKRFLGHARVPQSRLIRPTCQTRVVQLQWWCLRPGFDVANEYGVRVNGLAGMSKVLSRSIIPPVLRRTGNCTRFISRLWDDSRANSEGCIRVVPLQP